MSSSTDGFEHNPWASSHSKLSVSLVSFPVRLRDLYTCGGVYLTRRLRDRQLHCCYLTHDVLKFITKFMWWTLRQRLYPSGPSLSSSWSSLHRRQDLPLLVRSLSAKRALPDVVKA